jgi:anti-anti-sigma factor
MRIGGATQVTVVGELHDATCGRLASAWADALSGDRPVVLDLQACTFIDSIGLDVILRTAARLHSERRELVVCNLGGAVRELFQITGASDWPGLIVHRPSTPSHPTIRD